VKALLYNLQKATTKKQEHRQMRWQKRAVHDLTAITTQLGIMLSVGEMHLSSKSCNTLYSHIAAHRLRNNEAAPLSKALQPSLRLQTKWSKSHLITKPV
jgi:hypothetical protein